MSILSALRETRHDNNNLEDLAKLPQAMIMQMAQKGDIPKNMVLPILGKKAEMIESAARMKAAEALSAQGGAQPTVMDKYMGEIAQAENPAPPMPQAMPQAMPQQAMPQQAMPQAAPEPLPQNPEDIGIASQATAPMQMAGGGIIAFSGEDGSYVDSEDDDYQEAADDARETELNSKMYEMIADLKGSGSASKGSENRGVGISFNRRGAERGMEEGHRGAERGMEDNGDLEARLRATILGKESGGRRYDKEGKLLTSPKGAEGEMQVMPYTAKDPGFGIKPARSNHPDELRRVGDEYASMLLRRYNDPKVAMIAYNMGPGATDKWLSAGADIRKLPKETQQYIRGVNLAEGGEIRHFANDGYVGFGEEIPYDESQSFGLKDWWKRNTPGTKEFIAEVAKDKKKAAPAKPVEAPTPAAEKPTPKIPQSEEGIKNLQAKADDENFNLMQYIKDREARMDKAEMQDKNMALLSAGLGMLGGTSPYAFANIGQGGQMGVQQLAASQKLRAGQEAALGKLYGSAAQSDLLNKLRRDQLAQGKELKEDQMAQQLLVAKNNFIQKRMKEHGMDEMILGNLKKQQAMGKLDPAKLPELQYYENAYKSIENEANKMFASPSAGSGMRIVGVR